MFVQQDGKAAIAVDTVQHAPLGPEKLVLSLHGRWLHRRRGPDVGPVLVIEQHGRRHRFAAVPRPGRPTRMRTSAWFYAFVVPRSLASLEGSRMTLVVGEAEVSVEALSSAEHETNGADCGPPHTPRRNGVRGSADDPDQAVSGLAHDAPELVTALRAQLHDRAAALSRAHGVLTDVQAELRARTVTQKRLEATQRELRAELSRLSRAVGHEKKRRSDVESRALALAAELEDARQRVAEVEDAGVRAAELDTLRLRLSELAAERSQIVAQRDRLADEASHLRAELAESSVIGDAASAEGAAARAEIARLGRELAVARSDSAGRDPGLTQAQALLAEARELTAQLRAE